MSCGEETRPTGSELRRRLALLEADAGMLAVRTQTRAFTTVAQLACAGSTAKQEHRGFSVAYFSQAWDVSGRVGPISQVSGLRLRGTDLHKAAQLGLERGLSLGGGVGGSRLSLSACAQEWKALDSDRTGSCRLPCSLFTTRNWPGG